MNPRLLVLSLLVVASPAGAQDGKDNGVFEPGVQHVCVPAADGEGWDCGTVDAPPENYTPPDAQAESLPMESTPEAANAEPLPEPEPAPEPAPAADLGDAATPPPPPFLADPMRDTPYAPVEEPSPEPDNAAEAVIAAEQTVPAEPVAESRGHTGGCACRPTGTGTGSDARGGSRSATCSGGACCDRADARGRGATIASCAPCAANPSTARRSGSCARPDATCPSTAPRAPARAASCPGQDPGTGLRGHAAAAGAVPAGRRDPVLRHPHRARCDGPRPVLR
jgi:hypothetical protein